MSKPKRVSEVAELEAMIDRLGNLKNTRAERAAALDEAADGMFRIYGTEMEALSPTQVDRKALCVRQLDKAKNWRVKAERLRNFKSTDKRLKYFSNKLAELRTGTLPGMLPDNSVRV